MAFGWLAVDGDFCVLVGGAGDVGGAEVFDGADLGGVFPSIGVADFGEVLAVDITASSGAALRLPMPSKSYSNWLPGNGLTVFPVALGGDHLAKVVIAVVPVAAVFGFDAGALVGVIVAVVERLIKIAVFFEAAGADVGQSAKIVELPGRSRRWAGQRFRSACSLERRFGRRRCSGLSARLGARKPCDLGRHCP